MTAAVDWAGLERGLRDGVLRAARAWVDEHSAEPLGVVALAYLYQETDGPIHLPLLALAGADTFAACGPAGLARREAPGRNRAAR